ncbi:phage terminase small subunit [uncultured Brevundimonas sp.]|uniref:phage terminase small subunit n=1 Tax=uncultured Brevundimonas sp. TaxID=213418 RepID=UPI0025E2A0FE|nr:phage terminase small subunit [uncultured Brevundimonas sp.]
MSLIAKIRALQAAGEAVTPEALGQTVVVEDVVVERAHVAGVPLAAEIPAISPARLHRQLVLGRIMAASGSGFGIELTPIGDNDDLSPADMEIMQLKLQLIDHQQTLKATKSQETKIAIKRQFAPLYANWIKGVLEADQAPQREQAAELIATMMIWAIDCGEYQDALPLVEFVLKHKVPMPARFDRDVATFVTDQVAEAAIAAYEKAEPGVEAFPLEILGRVEDLVADADMHDQVKAKLQKAIGRALASDAGEDSRIRQEETLKRYQRAIELNPSVGVKKDIERLQSALKKSAPPAPPIDQKRVDQHADGAARAVVAFAEALQAAQTNTPAQEAD